MVGFVFLTSVVHSGIVEKYYSQSLTYRIASSNTRYYLGNQLLKFETLSQIQISLILSENLFQTWTLRSGTLWVYLSLSCGKFEYMHIAPLRRVHV